jgi:hypothetical protein
VKLSDIILAVGDENIVLQNLLESADTISQTKRGETRVSFFTDQITATEVATGATKKLGLVIWLPRDRIPPAGAPHRPAEMGWVIEKAESPASSPSYWAGWGWSVNHGDAIRYAREIDAENTRAFAIDETGLGTDPGRHRVCEHSWA